MSNIHILPGSKGPATAPAGVLPVNQALVELLRGLTAQAEAGVIQSFVGTGFTAQGQRLVLFADPHDDNFIAMLGALEWLKHEYTVRCALRGHST